MFVYLLLIVEILPLILTTAILPFFTFTVVFESLGAVVTVTLQVSFLPVVNVAVTVEVPLFRAVIFPLLTVATFLLELVQDFIVPPTTF